MRSAMGLGSSLVSVGARGVESDASSHAGSPTYTAAAKGPSQLRHCASRASRREVVEAVSTVRPREEGRAERHTLWRPRLPRMGARVS